MQATRLKADRTVFRAGERVTVYHRSEYGRCEPDNFVGAGEVQYMAGSYVGIRLDGEQGVYEWPAGWCWAE